MTGWHARWLASRGPRPGWLLATVLVAFVGAVAALAVVLGTVVTG